MCVCIAQNFVYCIHLLYLFIYLASYLLSSCHFIESSDLDLPRSSARSLDVDVSAASDPFQCWWGSYLRTYPLTLFALVPDDSRQLGAALALLWLCSGSVPRRARACFISRFVRFLWMQQGDTGFSFLKSDIGAVGGWCGLWPGCSVQLNSRNSFCKEAVCFLWIFVAYIFCVVFLY